MDVIFFFLLMIAIAVLSIPFGRDSRPTRDRFDHGWETDLRAARDREEAAGQAGNETDSQSIRDRERGR